VVLSCGDPPVFTGVSIVQKKGTNYRRLLNRFVEQVELSF